MAQSASLKDTYLEYLTCCNERRFVDISDFYKPTFRLNGAEITLMYFIGMLSELTSAIPDLFWELQDIVADDRKLAVRLTMTGAPISEWLGFAPNGRSIKVTEHAFYNFSEGKIADAWFLLDFAAIKAQLS